MRLKAFFLAPTHRQAEYWANLWGYRPPEWRFVPIGDWHRGILGCFEPDAPAFVCGTAGPDEELWFELKSRGFEVFDAETIEGGSPVRAGFEG